MELSNYHTHCHYCDGEDMPEAYIQEAIHHGLCAIGFSSHAPLPFPNDWSMKKRDIESYLSDIRMLKKGYQPMIDVFLGLEADFIPGKSDPKKIKEQYELDFVIGSIHYVKQFNSGVPFQIDGAPEDFERGFNEIFNRNSRSLITEYYGLVRRMVEESCPDIIGHLDKIGMHGASHQLFRETDVWYTREITKTLGTIKESGCMLEVNTRSMYKRRMAEPYPALWILEKVKALGIPIVLNSDAHRPNEIIGAYDRAIGMLKTIGFAETWVLKSDGWTAQPLEVRAVS